MSTLFDIDGLEHVKMDMMEINGCKFNFRPKTSDIKAIREVVERDGYQKRGMLFKEGEKWVDLGGNVGAFGIWCAKHGCTVEAYEPDENNYLIYQQNIELNGMQDMITLHKKAVVVGDQPTATFYISKTNNFWRNSLVKNWGGGEVTVDCINYRDVLHEGLCCKMDIEGSEIPILQDLDIKLKKLVYEHSFDMDDNIGTYRDIVTKLRGMYDIVKADNINEKHTVWQTSWFPPCKSVYCYGEEELIKKAKS